MKITIDEDELVRFVDGRIAIALKERAGARPISSRDFERDGDRRRFHAQCRDLAASGDARVWKIGRAWYAERSAFQPTTTTAPAAEEPRTWSVDAVLEPATRRASRGARS